MDVLKKLNQCLQVAEDIKTCLNTDGCQVLFRFANLYDGDYLLGSIWKTDKGFEYVTDGTKVFRFNDLNQLATIIQDMWNDIGFEIKSLLEK